MRRYLLSSALCLLYLLACVAYQDASAAERVAETQQDPRELLELGGQQFAKQEYPEAVRSFLRSVELIESRSGLLALELLEPLDALAKTYAATRQYEPMASTAQRALAVVRRTAGINDARQLPFLEQLVDAQSSLGLVEAALPSLSYRERVSTAVHGAESVEHASELTRIGDWYCRLGDFFASRQRHRSAIAIIEAAANSDSAALIEPLRAVARCCLTELATEGVESSPGVAQGFRGQVLRSRMDPDSTTFSKHVQELLRFDGEQAIVRAAQIASVPDNASSELQLEVFLQAADWFQLRDQPRAASEYYKRAYDVSLALPTYDQQQWSQPKPLLYALPPIALRNLLQGEAPRERYVEIAFTVRADGRVRSPEVVTREDAGKTMVDETITSLLAARYRPRLVDGKPTPAADVRWRQQF
jgi:hypothetical protein